MPSTTDCPLCKQFMINPKYHKCKPQWEVCFGDNLKHAIDCGVLTVYGADIYEAVEVAAEEDDCNTSDYSIVNSGSSPAWVRALGSDEWTELVVYGETVPQYSAYDKKK